MLNYIELQNLPLKDLLYAALIIFIVSTIIANIFNPLLAALYAIGNILTLAFLGWLYQESWSNSEK